MPGDTAIIDDGTVSLAVTNLDGLAVQLLSSATTSPTLVSTNSYISPSSSVQVVASSNDATLVALGNLLNSGLLALRSTGAGTATVLLPGDTSDSVLTNSGQIALDGSAQIALRSSSFATTLVNNGTVSINNSAGAFRLAAIRVGVSGTGTIGIGNGAYAEFSQNVDAGQTLQFAPGAAATVQLDAANRFQGTFAGFSAADKIILPGASFSTVSYQTTGPLSGKLVFSQNGVVLDTLAFSGDYAPNSFGISTSNSQATTIAATGAAPQRVQFTDTANNAQGADGGTYYTGPVNYLQWEYIWSSPDGVAIGASVDNFFLHGGSGDDAIAVHGGNNVVDGGGGSNFLVGGTGADGGTDTFFVDGRGGVETWSSIVNFHRGDAVTVFGFTAGVSTLPFTASDGAAGYTGATIHSELSGAGTGVNGSVTFAGISLADAQTKFTISTGSVGGANYLQIVYTG